MLAGNLVALLSPLIFIPLLTYVPPFKPQHYDWESMAAIRKADDHDVAEDAHIDLEYVPGEERQPADKQSAERAKLDRSAMVARIMTVTLTLALLVLWPMPMYGTGYIFSKQVSLHLLCTFPFCLLSCRLMIARIQADFAFSKLSVLHWLGRGWYSMAVRIAWHGRPISLVRESEDVPTHHQGHVCRPHWRRCAQANPG